MCIPLLFLFLLWSKKDSIFNQDLKFEDGSLRSMWERRKKLEGKKKRKVEGDDGDDESNEKNLQKDKDDLEVLTHLSSIFSKVANDKSKKVDPKDDVEAGLLSEEYEKYNRESASYFNNESFLDRILNEDEFRQVEEQRNSVIEVRDNQELRKRYILCSSSMI